MRAAVRTAFVPFTVPLEGVVPWMYPDVKGFVSVGIGNLIDPVELATELPFEHHDGAPASRAEIASEWHLVKNYPNGSRLGFMAFRILTQLRLANEGVHSLVNSKLDQDDRYLAKRFSGYVDWSADAQLATLSMAWACGPAFRFPKLEAALKDQDFETASVECFMPEEKTISGLRPRNVANRIMYRNAAFALNAGLDPEELFYPRDLNENAGGAS